MTTTQPTAVTFARNLARLMEDRALSQNELARRSGVGQRTLSTILNLDQPMEINPRSSTVQQLAEFFAIPAWQLFVPDMPLDLMSSQRLGRLIANYQSAPEDGRRVVEQVAEAQAHYHTAPPKPTKAR